MKTLLLSVFFTFVMSHNTCVRNPPGGEGAKDTVVVITEKHFIFDTTINHLYVDSVIVTTERHFIFDTTINITSVDSIVVVNQQFFTYDTTITTLSVDSVFVVDSLFTVYLDTIPGVIVDPSLVKHQPVSRVWVQWTQGGPFTPYYLTDSIR